MALQENSVSLCRIATGWEAPEPKRDLLNEKKGGWGLSRTDSPVPVSAPRTNTGRQLAASPLLLLLPPTRVTSRDRHEIEVVVPSESCPFHVDDPVRIAAASDFGSVGDIGFLDVLPPRVSQLDTPDAIRLIDAEHCIGMKVVHLGGVGGPTRDNDLAGFQGRPTILGVAHPEVRGVN